MWRALATLVVLASCAHPSAPAESFLSVFTTVCASGASQEDFTRNAVGEGFRAVAPQSDRRLHLASQTPIGEANRRIEAFARERRGQTLHVIVLRYESNEAQFTRCGLYDLASIAAADEVLASRPDAPLFARPLDTRTYIWPLDGYDQLRLRVIEPDGVAARSGFSGLSLEYDQVEAAS